MTELEIQSLVDQRITEKLAAVSRDWTTVPLGTPTTSTQLVSLTPAGVNFRYSMSFILGMANADPWVTKGSVMVMSSKNNEFTAVSPDAVLKPNDTAVFNSYNWFTSGGCRVQQPGWYLVLYSMNIAVDPAVTGPFRFNTYASLNGTKNDDSDYTSLDNLVSQSCWRTVSNFALISCQTNDLIEVSISNGSEFDIYAVKSIMNVFRVAENF